MQIDTVINVMIAGYCLMLYTHLSIFIFPFMSDNLLLNTIHKKINIVKNYLQDNHSVDLDHIISAAAAMEPGALEKYKNDYLNTIKTHNQSRFSKNIKTLYTSALPWTLVSILMFVIPLVYILYKDPSQLNKSHIILAVIATLTLVSEAYLYFFVFQTTSYQPSSLAGIANICTKTMNIDESKLNIPDNDE